MPRSHGLSLLQRLTRPGFNITTPALAAFLISLAPAAVHAAEEAHGGGADPFAGTIYQSLAAIIAFLLLLTILYKMAWGPILTGLQDREAKIREDLESAEKASAEAKATLDEYKAQLADARQQAQQIIEQGRRDAESLAAQLKDQTQAEIAGMRKRAQSEITTAREQALADIYAQAASLSTQIAGRILQRDIQPGDHAKLIDESVNQFRDSAGSNN